MGGAAVLVGLALVVWGQAQPIPDVIEARRFEVVNPWGQVVLRAAATFSGAELIVYAANEGGIRGELVSANVYGYLSLRGGDSSFLAMVTAADGGSLSLENKIGKTISSLHADKFGHGRFQICHRSEDKCKTFQYAPQ